MFHVKTSVFLFSCKELCMSRFHVKCVVSKHATGCSAIFRNVTKNRTAVKLPLLVTYIRIVQQLYTKTIS